MPVHMVKIDGKEGWRYGETGKLYTGPDARRKAMAQAAAIHASQCKKGSLSYMDVLEKMAAQDAWKPFKLELPKGLKMPKLKMPTWNDGKTPEQIQSEQQKKKKAEEQAKTLANPGSMDVTIKFRR